jgi:hypothetical protein
MKHALILTALMSFAGGLACSAQTVHYLDCLAGADAADSLTPQTAWRTVAKASAYTYHPGESLFLRRGSRCEGMLEPHGSGTKEASIHLGAYGRGALPVIAGGSQPAGVQLHDQQYWEIENLEISGGSPYGLHIGGTEALLRHFRITNVVVHDVPGEPLSKNTGLVVIAPDANSPTRFDDVIVDGVTAYRTTQWAGIIVSGAGMDSSDGHARGKNIEIRNSIVHDVGGDGILLASAAHGVLEHNIAWNTGMQETETIGTPNAIWEWRCSDCRVEYNEGYFSDSPGVDGGVFDIDYGNENNRVEYNFGHDSQGYCVAVFGAEGGGDNSIKSAIRHNTCIHNGRSPRLAKRQGAIFLTTWHGGKLNGVEIENNTVVWGPPLDTPAFRSTAEFIGDLPNRMTGNTILAASGSFTSSKAEMQFDGNRYCAPRAVSAQFSFAEMNYSDPQTQHSTPESDPAANKSLELCDCQREWLAKSAATAGSRSGTESIDLSGSPFSQTSRWVLLADLAPDGEQAEASRGLLVLIESMMHQFSNLGLGSIVVPAHALSTDQLDVWKSDWNFDSRVHIDASPREGLRKAFALSNANQLLLVSPSGKVVARWTYPVPPAEVWLQLQTKLGTPVGMQPMPVCTNQQTDSRKMKTTGPVQKQERVVEESQ